VIFSLEVVAGPVSCAQLYGSDNYSRRYDDADAVADGGGDGVMMMVMLQLMVM